MLLSVFLFFLGFLSSAIVGTLVGFALAWLFFRPQKLQKGPFLRICQVLLNVSLLLMNGVVWLQAFQPTSGLTRIQGACLAVSVNIGSGLALYLRRRNRNGNLSEVGGLPVSQSWPSSARGTRLAGNIGGHIRTLIRMLGRLVGYSFGVTACGTFLLGGSILSAYAKTWLSGRTNSQILLLLLVHLASFAYSQLVSSATIKALNEAVSQDWGSPRTVQYLLASGPFVFISAFVVEVMFMAPNSALNVISMGLVASLILQLLVLPLGYWLTDDPPAGPAGTVLHILQKRGLSIPFLGPSRRSSTIAVSQKDVSEN